MLVELSIRDLVLIERAELLFGAGLNAVTGETGAGKSLVVGALELLRGERPRGGRDGWIRAGADRALVEGRFELEESTAQRLREWFLENLPELADEVVDGELFLGRSLGRDGRTRAHVAHRPVPLRALKAVAALVLEIHGQNDHQSLLDAGEQARLLDAFGGLEERVQAYGVKRTAWLGLRERLDRADEERAERRDRAELLRYQLAELETAAPRAGESAELRAERALLRDAGELRGELGGWVDELSQREDAVLDRLRSAERTVEAWRERTGALEECARELREAGLHLEEAAGQLATFVDGVEVDPARLDEVEERLAELERLEHKYGVDGQALAELSAGLDAELKGIEQADEAASDLGTKVDSARAAVARAAADLSKRRRRVASDLGSAVAQSFSGLGLERARFEVEVQPRSAPASPNAKKSTDPEVDRARFGPRGADRIEFQLAANPGEELRSLADVASGGEAARVMLGVRRALAAGDSGRSLVFDEVDANVGGRLGPAVASSLGELAQHHQVILVTHLPAIAAAADRHLRVSKSARGGRTRTSVEVLDEKARVQEVADMIAGGGAEKTAQAEARRLLGHK